MKEYWVTTAAGPGAELDLLDLDYDVSLAAVKPRAPLIDFSLVRSRRFRTSSQPPTHIQKADGSNAHRHRDVRAMSTSRYSRLARAVSSCTVNLIARASSSRWHAMTRLIYATVLVIARASSSRWDALTRLIYAS